MTYYAPRFLFRRFEILRRVKQGGTFLEIGPGNLNLALDLLTHYRCGKLVELNPEVQDVFDQLEPSIRDRLCLIVDDFSGMDEFDARFDCVIACEVLEHVADDEAFVGKAVAQVREGGQLILSVPARMKYWSIDDEVVGHYRRYERADLQSLLAPYALDDVKILSYGYPFLNLLRFPRQLHARWKWRQKQNLTLRRRTEQSSQIDIGRLNWLSYLVNPLTVYPLVRLASLMTPLSTTFDLSDGYLVVATKRDLPSDR